MNGHSKHTNGVSDSSYATLSNQPNHPIIPSIAQSRLEYYFKAPYGFTNIPALANRARFEGTPYIEMTRWIAPTERLCSFQEAIKQLDSAPPIHVGDVFGPSFSNHWVRVVVKITDELRKAAKNNNVILEFDTSCEGLLYNEQGAVLHGLTGTSGAAEGTKTRTGMPSIQERIEHIIPQSALANSTYTVVIEVTCNKLMGVGGDEGDFAFAPPKMNRTFPLRSASVLIPNWEVRGLLWDLIILKQVAESGDNNRISSLPAKALKAANAILDTFDGYAEGDDVETMVKRCRDIARRILGDENTTEATADTHVWAIGHCHIDTAWLWRYMQSEQKVARSWTAQCHLMERWPSYQFAASSAQHYVWLEERLPEGFAEVRKYIEKGQFLPVGGSWVEYDTMLPSGESLIRQHLYGQRYFKEKFGSYCRELWLPDTFGYAAQLPQILRSVGIDYFFTQKLSWNNITVFPYTTFNWVALDGTQVLSHMTPVNNYLAQCNYSEIEKTMWNHKHRADTDQSLLLFGNGDGGGGPTVQHLEKLDRLSSLAKTHPEVSKVGFGSPTSFFENICDKTSGGKDLPTWHGELYLEFHRGTYTTQAAIKRGNKDMEQLLMALEYFATLASIHDTSYKYPRAEIEEMWRDTMLNQFHDVLPGSSIALVNHDAREIYAKRTTQARKCINSALKVISSTQRGDGTAVIDPLRLSRREVQKGARGYSYVMTNDGFGQVIQPPTMTSPRASRNGSAYTLESETLRFTITEGRITSLYDLLQERELIRPGPGADTGGLMLHRDLPLRFDAWDVEVYDLDTYEVLYFQNVETEEEPLRASLKATVKSGESTVVMTFSLDATEPGAPSFVRVEVEAEWHATHKWLKFVLPVDIRSSHAVYGTQFGVIERPTHRNTLQDQAKFEVCAHLLADLSDASYGVSLCSAAKYGYSVENNVMRMSLLRAPTAPDPTADQGSHHFQFAIMPHAGSLASSGVYQRALAFATPVFELPAPPVDGLPSFRVLGSHSSSIVLETIKLAEDDDSLIMRLYESMGVHAKAIISR